MTRKQVEKWERAFILQMTEALRATGIPEQLYLDRPEFTAETDAGPLSIHVYEGWVACRFQDPERALARYGSSHHYNGPSPVGKWNHHYGSHWPVKDCVSDFLFHLDHKLRKD